METSIQISHELIQKLKMMKMYAKESYEDLIWDLIEDRLEFSKNVKDSIKKYESDLTKEKKEKFTKLHDVKMELGIDV